MKLIIGATSSKSCDRACFLGEALVVSLLGEMHAIDRVNRFDFVVAGEIDQDAASVAQHRSANPTARYERCRSGPQYRGHLHL